MTKIQAVSEIQSTPVQKDEQGIDIINGRLETWNFVDTQFSFFGRFRRLVNIAGTRYAEVDHSVSSNGDRKVKYVRLTEFSALEHCKPGDDLHCRWILHKPYIFAANRGKPISQKEWEKISFNPDVKNVPPNYPYDYNRLMEG